MKLWQWCTVIAIFILMIVISYVDWNGSKVLKELQYNDIILGYNNNYSVQSIQEVNIGNNYTSYNYYFLQAIT